MPTHTYPKRLAVLVLVSAPGVWFACASDSPNGHHPYGDSRYGQVGSPLSVPSGDPYLDFDQNSSDGSIALTFDDGPDTEGNTAAVLDILKSKSVRATFFINTDNAVNVNSSSTAQYLVQRMVAEGHQIGNHTVHHYDFNNTSTNVEGELEGVETVLRAIAPTALDVRLVRAPYGNPYFGPQDRLDEVSPIVAHHGVHVGWSIDSLDWKCQSDRRTSQCVFDNVLNAVDSGHSGIVLLHAINPLTRQALPAIIDALRAREKRFAQVESYVVAKYGKPSRRLFRCTQTADCVAPDVCGASGYCEGSSGGTDAGTDSATDTGAGTTTTLACSNLTVTKGSLGGNSSNPCAALTNNDSTYVEWNAPSTDAYATYASPWDAAHVAAMSLRVAYRGDDATEPLWEWSMQDAATGAWVKIGDNSWAGNWTTTTHTFSISTPGRFVDASNRVRVRFRSPTSTNSAELNQMVLVLNETGSTTDSGTADTGTADTAVTDSGTDAVTDTTTPITDTVTCSAFTTTSGSFYGSVSSACSGTSPALASADGRVIGWAARSGTPKSSAYATYVSPVPASSMSALRLVVRYRGDDASEPPWAWYAQNIATGAWELVGDNSWAANWSFSNHTFVIADPARYVASDRTVRIRFTTAASTNDAELDRMVLEAVH